jgi:hypothetical protein
MKMNKWTVGLAAAGVVSLSSVAQAQEAAANAVQTKLATTSLSGYVSTSYSWLTGDNSGAEQGARWGSAANDGFSLDVVSLSLGSPMGSGEWATGYNVQLWLGPDSNELDVGGDAAAVKNAYVELRVPVGSGLDLQVGRFDTIIGYEGVDYNNNPFYSHSWGFAIEPTIHTGIKASYQVADELSVSALVANKLAATDNTANTGTGQSGKTYGLAATIGAPDSFGALADAELTVGYLKGTDVVATGDVQNLYVGASIPTPIENLSAGVALDIRKQGGTGDSDTVLGLYLAYQVNDQLTANVRVERVQDGPGTTLNSDLWDFTVGANYSLWDGVTTRAEWRTTIQDAYTGVTDTGDGDQKTSSISLNVIYEF